MVERKLTPVDRFWRVLKPDKAEIWNVYIYAIFNGLVYLAVPLGIQAIVNLIQGGQISTSLLILVLFVVLGLCISGVFQVLQLRITENIQQKIFARASFEFAYRIPRIKMEELYRHYAPELMNRFFDTISLQKGLSKILIDFSTASLQVFFALILLSLYHPFFILFSLILILLVGFIFRFTAKRGLVTSITESKHKYAMAHWLEELARTAQTFKLSTNSNLSLIRTDNHLGAYLSAREKHFRILIQQYGLMIGFKVVVAAGLLALGGVLVINQQMNIGQFVAAEIIILYVLSSVEKLVLSLETIYDILTSLEKIGQVTDLELESSEGLDLTQVCQEAGIDVELQEVNFTYPDQSQPALIDLSLSISAGEKVAISGSNGSGKSSLLNILAGLYDVQSGIIAYNGLPKGNININSLRTIIGHCLSDEQLFNGTVFENIAMGQKHVSFNEVRTIAEKLRLDAFIKTLPNGFNTVLDPQGKRLPRSIIQKLLLARSVVGQPKLLLLEDFLKPFDYQEQKSLIEFLTAKENGWTLVAVTSQPDLIERCDAVVLMDGGKIVKRGRGSEYRSLMDQKFPGHA